MGPAGIHRVAISETLAGSGIQADLSTNTLIFQHSPNVRPETVDRRGFQNSFAREFTKPQLTNTTRPWVTKQN
jgi:hypothetical protein